MYESRIYVVSKTRLYDEKLGKYYADLDSMFNLGGVHEFEDIIKKYQKTDSFICVEDSYILEDKYGEELTEIPVESLIEELSPLTQKYLSWTNAPQLYSLLNTLLAIKPFIDSYRRIVCLHYGY
jgi:hypothetical protein